MSSSEEFLKESPAYYWMANNAYVEGFAESFAESFMRSFARDFAQSFVQGLENTSRERVRIRWRDDIARAIEKMFPEMKSLAQKLLPLVQQTDSLRQLSTKLAQAQTPEQIKCLLCDAIEGIWPPDPAHTNLVSID